MSVKRLIYIKYMSKRLKYKLLADVLGFKYRKKNKVRGSVLPNEEQTSEIIIKMIDEGTPFCLLRPGNGEYSLASQWDEHILFGTKRYQNQKMYEILDKEDSLVKRWVEAFEKDLKEADIFAFFGEHDYMEHYLMEVYAKPRQIIRMGYIDALQLDKAWWQALEGRKVLVISPFVETMKTQYQRRDLVWGDKKVLPEMDIRFVKSVWYLNADDNSGFSNWFEALEYLYEEASKIDFDIALIGCGPFSTFLAARFKRDGKSAIQCGGFLQILFGIRGARWDNNEHYNRYFNEYWVRASKEDAPKSSNKLDDKCYW